ncbi:MAG: hypothetical protein ACJ0PA_01185 [Flavobacteriaceae bacterium]
MRKLLFLLFIPLVSFSQTFELTNGQSMCMIGKGMGQDATINPYANEEFSYALIENIGTVKFNIRAESIDEERREVIIKPKDIVVVKLYRNNILYFDSLTAEKAEAKIKYTINENELPPPPPPVK